MKVGETWKLKDIPKKNIKMNSNIFNNFGCLGINHYEGRNLKMLAQCMYHSHKKRKVFPFLMTVHVHKKKEKSNKTY